MRTNSAPDMMNGGDREPEQLTCLFCTQLQSLPHLQLRPLLLSYPVEPWAVNLAHHIHRLPLPGVRLGRIHE